MCSPDKFRFALAIVTASLLLGNAQVGNVKLADGDFGYAFLDRLWPKDSDRTARVAVCWIDRAVDVHSKETALVRDAIAKSWEQVARIEFYGWRACAPDSSGIRIEVRDVPSKVTAFGHMLEDKDTDGVRHRMYLNFTFANWGTSCREAAVRESCIRAIAVHEFGHAIGFAHEQDRDDAPTECSQMSFTGSSGQKLAKIGEYDAASTMNYCNLAADGSLSTGDIAAARKLYGART